MFQGKTAADVQSSLQGRRVNSVCRKGKYFWFTFAGPKGPDLVVHFGMTGYASVKGVGEAKYVQIKASEEWPPRFTKLRLVLDDGTDIAIADARRSANLCTPL